MSILQVFPHLKHRIFGAPMAGVSGPDLALAVSRAGGIGLIGAGYDLEKFRSDLTEAIRMSQAYQEPVQFGFGFFTFAIPDPEIIHDIIRSVRDEKLVNAVWLFGGSEEAWIPALKKEFSEIAVIVQVHTVQAAKLMVEAGADVIVAQGSDAGGHGGAQCSSIVTLVPEIIDACPGVPVLAAGGVSDGRSILAAQALGAEGVVVGTRFMVSEESTLAKSAKDLACKTEDGGRTTIQTRVYDNMRGTTDWPLSYTGRAIRNKTIEESLGGRDEADLKRDYTAAMADGDYTRIVCWGGTGIGLVKEILPAAKIVQNMVTEYAEAKRALQSATW